MEKFFQKFPGVAYIVMTLMVGIIVYQNQILVKNNTEAMNGLRTTLEKVSDNVTEIGSQVKVNMAEIAHNRDLIKRVPR